MSSINAALAIHPTRCRFTARVKALTALFALAGFDAGPSVSSAYRDCQEARAEVAAPSVQESQVVGPTWMLIMMGWPEAIGEFEMPRATY